MANLDHLAGRADDTLEYIHAMLGQLRNLAQAEHLDLVAHFIEMAYIQAADTRRGEEPRRHEALYRGLEQRDSVA